MITEEYTIANQTILVYERYFNGKPFDSEKLPYGFIEGNIKPQIYAPNYGGFEVEWSVNQKKDRFTAFRKTLSAVGLLPMIRGFKGVTAEPYFPYFDGRNGEIIYLLKTPTKMFVNHKVLKAFYGQAVYDYLVSQWPENMWDNVHNEKYRKPE